MKRKILLLAFFHLTFLASAQVGRWLIHPNYDSIQLTADNNLVVTDSSGIITLWSKDGNRLAATHNRILPWVEGKAVVINNEGAVEGFYTNNAKFYPLTNCFYRFDNFRNGYLRVSDGEYDRFVDKDGKIGERKYIVASDFSNGYASCSTYQNLDKRKDPYLLLLDTEGNDVTFFTEKGKVVKQSDIQFISQVNDENLGVVIINENVFFFNGKDRQLSPVYASKSETNPKKQAKLMDNLEKIKRNEENNQWAFDAKCGKSDNITFTFDSLNVPVGFQSGDNKVEYKKKVKTTQQATTNLKKNEGKDNDGYVEYGIDTEDGTEVLPPQFKKIERLFDNKALVKHDNGKYGMIGVFRDEHFNLSINENNGIGFKHGKTPTKIRLELPKDISSKKSELEMQVEGMLELGRYPKHYDTNSGNYIDYECIIQFPDTLATLKDPTAKVTIKYPAWVIYDGLYSPVIEATITAWYDIYLVATMPEKSNVEKGVVSFTVEIEDINKSGDGYFWNVSLEMDSLTITNENHPTRYKYEYTVEGLKEGMNIITVNVAEDDCPILQYPFEIYYPKPIKVSDKTVASVKKNDLKIKRSKSKVVVKQTIKKKPVIKPNFF